MVEICLVHESGAWKTWILPFPLKILLLDFLGHFGPSRHHSSVRFSRNEANLTKQVVRLNILAVLMSLEKHGHIQSVGSCSCLPGMDLRA